MFLLEGLMDFKCTVSTEGSVVTYNRFNEWVETDIPMTFDFDRNVNADGGYTGWTQFDDGEIYVVNYIRDDADKAYIRGYSFYPEDVQLPSSDNNSKGVF